MSSQKRIRCVVAVVIMAMALLAAGPAEAAGGRGDDLSGLLDRAWQWLAGWLVGAPGSEPTGPGGLRGIFENDGPHIDPNGAGGPNPTGNPVQVTSRGGERASIDPRL